MIRTRLFLIACLAAAGLSSVPALAGVILQPTAATSDMSPTGFTPNNARNQSGLSLGYTSLVTDFDTYIAANPTHNAIAANSVWTSSPLTTGNLDFTLGGTYTVESFALWNVTTGSGNASAVQGFSLLAGNDPSFAGATVLGSYIASNIGPGSAAPAQVFTFAPTSASYIRMQISSNYGAARTSIGEAAFEVSTVPEPASALLLGIGAIGLAGLRGSRRA